MLRDAMVSRDSELKYETRLYPKNPFMSGFVLIFITEWGDKTQIASAVFATRYNALMVFIGTMVALTMLSIVAIYLGKVISNRIDKKLMTKIVGFGFIAMGISFFFF